MGYHSMAMYYDRDDVALPGFSAYFQHNSDEEREHAEKFMKYLNKRGGRVILNDVKRPSKDEWGTGLEGLEAALDLEKLVNQSLLDLHEQVNAIKEYGDLVTKCKRAGPGLGEFLFDK